MTTGAGASGKKQERAFKKARNKPAKLPTKAGIADRRGTLGVLLDPITAAVATCCP